MRADCCRIDSLDAVDDERRFLVCSSDDGDPSGEEVLKCFDDPGFFGLKALRQAFTGKLGHPLDHVRPCADYLGMKGEELLAQLCQLDDVGGIRVGAEETFQSLEQHSRIRHSGLLGITKDGQIDGYKQFQTGKNVLQEGAINMLLCSELEEQLHVLQLAAENQAHPTTIIWKHSS